MAKVDLERRAQIGQEKRARTRAQIIAAATTLFAHHAVASVTVDEVVAAAGVAKGTFYVHFADLDALASAVADELIATFDELLQERRLGLADPLTRIAFGCNSFFLKALDEPVWASLVARISWSDAAVGRVARLRLQEDLARVLAEAHGATLGVPAGLEVVLGIMVQSLMAFGSHRLTANDRLPIVDAILRTLGADKRRVRSALSHLPDIMPDASAEANAGAPDSKARRTARLG